MADTTAEAAKPDGAPANQAPRITETTSGRFGTFEALSVPNFRLLLIGTTLSNAAMWIQQVTLGWLVYDITGSGAMLGTLNAMRSVATVGLAPFSGAAIDRVSRRSLMLATSSWMLVASLILGLVLLSGHREVWYLFVFTLVGGVAQTIDMPLRQTVVFVLVPRHLAPNAVALVQTGWSLMRSLGPAVGGFLILWLGAGGNFLLQAVLCALIFLNTLRIVFPTQQTPTTRRSMAANIREGLAYVARERTTRTFLVMGWVLPLLIVPVYVALPPIYAKEVFGGGPEVLGLLLSSAGVGGIFGGLFIASISKVDRRGLVQLSALFLTAVSLMVFAFSPNLPFALFWLGMSGFFEMIFLTSNQTLLQLSIPDELRGRVTAITTLSAGLAPLGAMIGGVGSDMIGPREITMVLSGAAGAVAVYAYLFVPLIRNYSISRSMSVSRAGTTAH